MDPTGGAKALVRLERRPLVLLLLLLLGMLSQYSVEGPIASGGWYGKTGSDAGKLALCVIQCGA